MGAVGPELVAESPDSTPIERRSEIYGPITIETGSGSNVVAFDDTPSPAGYFYHLTTAPLERSNFIGFDYQNEEALVLVASSGDDEIQLPAVPLLTTVAGGTGSDPLCLDQPPAAASLLAGDPGPANESLQTCAMKLFIDVRLFGVSRP